MLVGTLSSSSIIFSDSFPCSPPALAMDLVFSSCVLFSAQRLIAVNINMFDDIDGSLGTLSNKSVSPDLQQYSGLAVTQPLMGYLLSCHFHKQCGGQIELCISGGDHGGTPEVCLENGNSLASLI